MDFFLVDPISEISFEESDISLNPAHALTWVGFGGQSLEVHRCRSVPIWCAAAARWCSGSGKQSPFPAKDRLNSSTRTRRKATIKPTSPLGLSEKLFPERFSSKSGNNSLFFLLDPQCPQEIKEINLKNSHSNHQCVGHSVVPRRETNWPSQEEPTMNDTQPLPIQWCWFLAFDMEPETVESNIQRA